MKSNGFQVRLRHTKITEIKEEADELPPDYGPMREYLVADYFCPENWSNDGVFIEAEEGMPFWIDFRGNGVCAVIPSIQRLNPVTHGPVDLESGLQKDPKQNYLLLPDQIWMDGFAKDGKVYQFMVTKEGVGLAVSEYVLPAHMQDSHALGFAFFAPKEMPPVQHNIEYRPSNNDWYQWHWFDYQKNRGYWEDNDMISNPIWFSPLHTAHNWKSANSDKVTSYTPESGSALSRDPTRALTDPLVVGACGAAQQFTQSRVADNYNEVIESNEDIIDGRVDTTAYCLASNEDIDHTQFDKASIGMGGRIEQKMEVDTNTVDFYKKEPSVVMPIYLALPAQFKAIMKKGLRQDASRKDDNVHSGEIGGVQVPLMVS